MKGFFFIGYLSEEEFVEIAMQGTDAAFSILGGIVFTNDFSEHNMSFNIKYKIRLASITVSASVRITQSISVFICMYGSA